MPAPAPRPRYRLTEYDRPGAPMISAYGETTWLSYCEREVARIGAVPGRRATLVRRRRDGFVAVFVNCVSRWGRVA